MNTIPIDSATRMPTITPSDRDGAAYRRLAALLLTAGIELGGNRPWDIQLRHRDAAARILAGGSLGFGESYMLGWWDCAALDQCVARILAAGLDATTGRLPRLLQRLKGWLFNQQTRSRASQVALAHYDLGNAFFAAMLDDSMTYSCAYWAQATTLEDAQHAKLDLVCRKLGLQPGMRLLDIGSGWGSLARFAAERYGVECVGLTVSAEQATAARARCQGLPVCFVLADYRVFAETERRPFDRVASLGMLEHVGQKNYRHFFAVARQLLKPGGLFLLHTIGSPNPSRAVDPWIDRYIFPNHEVPRLNPLLDAMTGTFVLEDLHNMGADYDPTLMAWHARFEKSWPTFAAQYGEVFHRMWRYYLLASAATFRTRQNAVWQLMLSPNGVPGGYHRPDSR